MLGHALTLAVALAAPQQPLAPTGLELVVHAGDVARVGTPISVRLDGELGPHVVLRNEAGAIVAAQVERDGALLHFVLDRLAAGEAARFSLATADPVIEATADISFDFVAGPASRALRRGDRTVWRAMTAFDTADRENTYKAFHHLHAPDGRPVTKGPGGEFPHHRGLFAGWNRTRQGERTFDFWHCGDHDSIRHVAYETDHEIAGQVIAREAGHNEWVAGDGTVVVDETMRLTTWRQPAGRVLIDVAVELAARAGRVELDGDPQHGGVQIRLADELANADRPVTYLRSEGAATLGDDVWTNCRWAAARIPVEGGELVVAHVDHPDNPTDTVYATRPYGRFGAFCRLVLEPGAPATLRYRVLLVDRGDAAACAQAANDLARPPVVEIRRR